MPPKLSPHTDRLPPGISRTAYDADTRRYTFRDANSKSYTSSAGDYYGEGLRFDHAKEWEERLYAKPSSANSSLADGTPATLTPTKINPNPNPASPTTPTRNAQAAAATPPYRPPQHFAEILEGMGKDAAAEGDGEQGEKKVPALLRRLTTRTRNTSRAASEASVPRVRERASTFAVGGGKGWEKGKRGFFSRVLGRKG
ncbi:hypothetical protein BU16DRAFT_559692 [Lophium mytilinum]|uniref:Uncharacterized protein n=1 Tax=Lophium mytilinum TaxID=390894 RepID=A0A6A6QZT6_9PEZI|nr:hypothetical protein BU16DRAFT_559692 [Lophium mytilinum]